MKRMSTSELRAQLASLVAGGGRWAFRGEDQIYSTTVPTIARLRSRFASSPDLDVIRGQAYTIVRRTHQIRDRFLRQAFKRLEVTDMPASPLTEDLWYSLLQHYGWLTHYLDISLNSEVAIWFALLKNDRRTPAVVYAVNLDALPPTVREVNHAALNLSPYDLLNGRWVTQEGAMLVPTGWPDMTAAEALDLRAPEFAACVGRFEFVPTHGDAAEIAGDLLASNRDWLAPVVRNIIHFVAGGVDASHRVIQEHIEKIG